MNHPVLQGAVLYGLQADATYPHGLQRGVLVLVARRITVGIAARPIDRETEVKQILISVGGRKKIAFGILQEQRLAKEHRCASDRAQYFVISF